MAEALKSRAIEVSAPSVVVDTVGELDGVDYLTLSERQRIAVGLLVQQGRKWGIAASVEASETERAASSDARENGHLAIAWIVGEGYAPAPIGVVRLRTRASSLS